ncbi:MAG: hypothetical protein E7631_02665 [Ruminococcaceae bacterium]|nr:hypothetical protein [Oscillospiraceae bacterium]
MEDSMRTKKILAFLISAVMAVQAVPMSAAAVEAEIQETAEILEEPVLLQEEPEEPEVHVIPDVMVSEKATELYAAAVVSGDFEYAVKNDDTATITGFVGEVSGDLVIPGVIDGYTVTEIGNYAFYNCSGFTGSLTIPDSVTSIGEGAFSDCSGFTGSLTIPDSVTSIGNHAFSDCSGFTGSLTIGDSVTSIGYFAFYNCSDFTGSLTIPDSVTSIGDYAFECCSGFTGSLTIPDSVTSIGGSAFSECSGFTGSLTIGDSVTSIEDYAFFYCSGFTGSLTIPDSVTSIGESAFQNCSGFTGSLTIPDSVTSIGNYAFSHCSGFTGSLTIPDSVTSIGDYAFYNCSGFTGSLTIPDSVTSIGEFAFYDCSGFTGSLTIPDSVTSIGNCAFYYCSGFTGSLTIPDSVTSIGESAFYCCYGFTGSLTIPDSVTSIGWGAFYNCSGFTGSLTIGDSVTSIGDEAFYKCYGFTGSLTIGDSVTSIGDEAFYNCYGFTGSLTIPDSVTSIGDYAFYYCYGFTGSLTIPDSVTSIGDYAFKSCSGFTGSLIIGDSVISIGTYAFDSCSGFSGELIIGKSVTLICDSAFRSCYNFTGSLTIPSSVETIEYAAFAFCRNIHNVFFNGDIPANLGGYFFFDFPTDFTIYYPEGNTSGWTSPTWTAPDGTVYNTATFVPDQSITVEWDTASVTLIVGDSYDFSGEVRSSFKDLYAVHFTVNNRTNQADGIDYFRTESPGRYFRLDEIPSLTAGEVLTGLQVTNGLDSLELVPGEYIIRMWVKDTAGNSVYKTKELTVIEKQIVLPPETMVQPTSIKAGESAAFTLTAYEKLTDVYVQFMLTDGSWMNEDTCAEEYALSAASEEDGVYTYTADITLNTPGNMYDGNRRYFRFVYTDGEGRVNYTDLKTIVVTTDEKQIELKIISGGTQSDSMIHMNDVKIVLSVVSDDGSKPKNVSIDYLDGDSSKVSFYYNKDTRQIIGNIISTPEGEEVLYTLQLNIQYAGDDNIYQIARSLFVYPVDKETNFIVKAIDKDTQKEVAVSGATVEIYSDRNGKNLVATLPPTDANGRTSYTWNGKYKNLYAVAYKKVASEMTEHDVAGEYEKYYLELRSDTIEPSNGEITIDQIHQGKTVTLLLDRPKFHLNLTVAYFVPKDNWWNRQKYKEMGAFEDYYDDVAALMKETNKRLLESTDGYFCIDTAYIYSTDKDMVEEGIADINCSYRGKFHVSFGSSTDFTIINNQYAKVGGIHIAKYPLQYPENSISNDTTFYDESRVQHSALALVHEIGHYVLGLLDEYLSNEYDEHSSGYLDWDYDINEIDLYYDLDKEYYFGLMSNQIYNHELSYSELYSYLYIIGKSDWSNDMLTRQYVNTYRGKTNMSCWEWLKNTYYSWHNGVIDSPYIYYFESPAVYHNKFNEELGWYEGNGVKYQTPRTFSDFTDTVTIVDCRTSPTLLYTSESPVLYSDNSLTYDVRTPIAYAGVIYDTAEQTYKVKLIPQLSGEIHLYDVTSDVCTEILLTEAEDGCLYGILDSYPEDGTSVLFELEMTDGTTCYLNSFYSYVSDPVLEYNSNDYGSGFNFTVAFSFETLNRFIITEMEFVDASPATLNKGGQPYYIAIKEETDYKGYLSANAYGALDLTTLAWYRFEDGAWNKCESETDIGMDGVVVSTAADVEGLYMILGEPASEENTLSVITDLQAIPVDTIDGGILFTFTDNNDAEEVLGYSVYYSKTPFTDTNDALYYPNLFTDSIITLTFPEAGCEYYLAAIIHGLEGSISELSEVVSCVSGVHMMEGSNIPVSWQQKYCLWDIPGEIIDDKDNDGDGLTNLEEYLEGTDPLTADNSNDVYSDLNADGLTDEADALYLLRHTLLPERYPLPAGDADYDADGTVTAKDAVYLYNKILTPAQYTID